MAKEPPDNIVDFKSARKNDPSWIARLAKNEHGGWHPTLANALLILEYDPPLSGMLAYNAMTCQALITRAPPVADDGLAPLGGSYPRPWEACDVALIQAYLQRAWSARFGRDTTEQAMLTVAAQHQFHPVRGWLDTLIWDGIPRLDTWLSRVFGAADDDYHAAVGAKFLIAAVRRVRTPGCKFDQSPILEGPQEIGKSTACRKLFGDAWFTDSIPVDLGSRDAALALAGPWCIELAEIDALLRSETETVKAFLSRQVERYRPPYGRNFVERPRQCVLIGTTNSDDYLRDATGNRRFWPIKCQYVDLQWICDNREQLWAEAASREAAGEEIWISEIGAKDIARKEQENRLPEDLWTDRIEEYLAGQREVSLSHLLATALSIPAERHGRREQMRAANVLKILGWRCEVVRKGQRICRIWRRKNER